MHGTVRGLFKVIGAVGMLMLLLFAWTVYRISQAPLSISGLTPYIEAALSQPGSGMKVHLDDTILAWSSQQHSLEIEGVRVRVVGPSGAELAVLPEMSVSLSGKALLHGKIVPRAVRLIKPMLHLLRDETGDLSFGIGNDENVAPGTTLADAGVDALLAPPGQETLAGQLQRIEVVGGALTIDDRLHGVRWNAPAADLTFARDLRGIAVKARLDLEIEGQNGHITADGVYLNNDRTLDVSFSGAGIRPGSLAKLSPQLDFLAAMQIPIGGTISLRYRLGVGIQSLKADLAAGEGVLDLTAMAGFAVPLKAIDIKAHYEGEVVTLDQLRVDLGGAIFTAGGNVEGIGGDMKIALHSEIDALALDDLSKVWPARLAPNPRAWMVANLSHGNIHDVGMTFLGHVAAGRSLGDLQVDSVSGVMSVDNTDVRYVEGLPPVLHVNGTVTFDADNFNIKLRSGDAGNLGLAEGLVVLKGLSKRDQEAVITLKIAGAITDILQFIDHPPLGWPTKLGINAKEIKGSAQLRLAFEFPLINKLSLDQLRTKVDADVTGFFYPHVLRNLDLTDGVLHLAIDNDGLDAVGTAQIDHRPALVQWRENFDKGAFRSRYQVSAQLSEQGRIAAGLDGKPFQPPYLTGILPIELTALSRVTGQYDIAIKAALNNVAIAVPGLNLQKPLGQAGTANAELQLIDSQLVRLSQLRIKSADKIDIAGDMLFDRSELRRINLQYAKWGRTELNGNIVLRPNDRGLTISANGANFDAREVISGQPSDLATDRASLRQSKPPRQYASPPAEVIPMTIDGHFDRVWLSDQGSISNVTAHLIQDHIDWRRIDVTGEVGNHAPVSIAMAPLDDRHSTLLVQSGDGGSVFRALDVFDNMQGGQLKLTGQFDDRDPRRPLTGQLVVREFQLSQAPVLAKLLTVAGLTGILDLMSGQGIHFTLLDAPFSVSEGILHLHDAHAAGNSLGVTAKGRIDLDNDKLGLEGTIVPAYAINSALGDLPVIGGLFRAEEGGGLWALNYQMKGPSGNPDFMVNPLSALTPGFFRRFFNLFDTDADRAPKPQP